MYKGQTVSHQDYLSFQGFTKGNMRSLHKAMLLMEMLNNGSILYIMALSLESLR